MIVLCVGPPWGRAARGSTMVGDDDAEGRPARVAALGVEVAAQNEKMK
jgi:hypothetical protein